MKVLPGPAQHFWRRASSLARIAFCPTGVCVLPHIKPAAPSWGRFTSRPPVVTPTGLPPRIDYGSLILSNSYQGATVERSRFALLLTAGFAVLLALLIAAALLGVWRASNTFSHLEQVVAEYNVQATLAHRMHAAARGRLVSLWKLSLSDDPFEREEFFQEFQAGGTTFLTARAQFAKAPLSDRERALIESLTTASEAGGVINRAAAQQILESGGLGMGRQILDQTIPAQNKVVTIVDELIRIQDEKSREARRSVAAENEETIYTILALMSTALVLGAFLAGFVSLRYSAMLADMRKTRDALDQANRDLEMRIEERTRELSAVNARLEQMAHHDALTGLANRHLLTTQMQLLLAQAARAQQRLAVLFIDLDGFKAVNDELGHDAGDRLLVEIAEMLTSTTRQADLAARVGGDEFVVVLTTVHDAPEACAVAAKIIAAWQPYAARYATASPVTLSIGISLYPDDADGVEVLLTHADHAMYEVKRGAKNGCRLYAA